MSQLEGKIAVITGAKGGLGTFVTEAFLTTGARVVGVSRSIQSSDFSHPNFTAMTAELSNVEGVHQLAGEIVAQFSRIDVLVHVMGGFDGGPRVEETNDATISRMFNMNFHSAFFVARAVLPYMRRQNAGRFLAVASRQAVDPAPGVGAYSASKAALVSLVRTIALENRDRGISANTVLPGTMDTPANRAAMPNADPSQWVKPADVAALLLHLATDSGGAITGAAIPIFGSQP